MNRLLMTLALCLLLCAPAWACDDDACRDDVGQLARMSPAILGASGGAAACDSCTGGLVFAAYFEDASGDVTLGVPCGCSAGDTTGTSNDSCTITGGYLYSADGGKYFAWDVSSGDILNDEAGSILIEFETASFAGGELFSGYVDANNRVDVHLYSTDEIQISHKGDSATTTTAQTAGTDNLMINTRYFVVARWTTADVDPDLSIVLYNSSGVEIDSGSSNINLTAFAADKQLGASGLKIGNRLATDIDAKIYKVKIWSTYDGAPTSGF